MSAANRINRESRKRDDAVRLWLTASYVAAAERVNRLFAIAGRCDGLIAVDLVLSRGADPPYGSVNLRVDRSGHSEVKRAPPTKR